MNVDDTIPIAPVRPGPARPVPGRPVPPQPQGGQRRPAPQRQIQAPPPAPPRRSWWGRHWLKVLIAAVVVIVLPLVVVGLGVFQAVKSATALEQAAVGSCAQLIGATDYEPIDCGDPKATRTILAQLPHGQDCSKVDGATEEASNGADDAKTTCLGRKGVDPATSTQGIKAGDCLTKDMLERRPCDSPEAAGTVVRRLDGVQAADAATACDGVPDADVSIDEATTESSSVAGLGASTTEGDHTVLCVKSR